MRSNQLPVLPSVGLQDMLHWCVVYMHCLTMVLFLLLVLWSQLWGYRWSFDCRGVDVLMFYPSISQSNECIRKCTSIIFNKLYRYILSSSPYTLSLNLIISLFKLQFTNELQACQPVTSEYTAITKLLWSYHSTIRKKAWWFCLPTIKTEDKSFSTKKVEWLTVLNPLSYAPPYHKLRKSVNENILRGWQVWSYKLWHINTDLSIALPDNRTTLVYEAGCYMERIMVCFFFSF